MRISVPWLVVRTATVALIAALAGSAVAGELLVMPYTCKMAGGRPQLYPSSQQGHRIIGAREERPFKSCSHVNPELCRTWTIERFTLDCAGVPVSWVAIAAASLEGPDPRGFIENGLLVLKMPPAWSLAPDDPCARGPAGGPAPRFGPLARYCRDRADIGQPAVVEMPPGFAPMLGLDGIFVPDNGAVAAGPAPAATVGAGAPLAAPRAAAVALPKRKPAEAAVAEAAPVAPAKAAAKTDTAPLAPVVSAPAAVTPVAPVAAAQPPPAPAALPTPAAAGSAPPAPPVAPAAPVPTVAAQAPNPAETMVTVAEALAARQKQSAVAAGDDMAATRPVKLPGADRRVSPPTVLIAAALASTLFAAIWWFRRRPATGAAPARPGPEPVRDFANVSLPSGGGGQTSANLPALLLPEAGSAVWPQEPGLMDGPRLPGLYAAGAEPRTRDEALAVLGMGVSEAASETALKKIVDGLRLSWHPDLATNEADRQVREARLRQINTAWDILNGGRRPASGLA